MPHSVCQQLTDSEVFVDASVGASTQECELLNEIFSSTEIVDAMKHLKTGKCAGADNVLGEMQKCSATFVTPYLLKLFNRILNVGLFPRCWRKSIYSSST